MGDGASSSSGGGAAGGGGSGESVVSDQGPRRSSCGYCRSADHTSIVHGLSAFSLTVYDYQEASSRPLNRICIRSVEVPDPWRFQLIPEKSFLSPERHHSKVHRDWVHLLTEFLDRGWRRSGSFLYKPEMEKTCCPSYTIRLNVGDFVPSKEQVRVHKRMQRFLDGMLDMKKIDQSKNKQIEKKHPKVLHSASDNSSLATKSPKSPLSKQRSMAGACGNKQDEYMHYLSSKIDGAVEARFGKNEFAFPIQLPKAVVKNVRPQAKKKLMGVSEDLLYTSNISFQIAAALRRSQTIEHNSDRIDLSRNCAGQSGEYLDISPNTVAEKLACAIEQLGESPGLSVRACNGHLNFYSVTEGSGPVLVSADAVTQSSRGIGSNSKHNFAASTSVVLPHKRRKLEIRMKRSSFDPEEFALYRKYQIRIHDDKPEKVTEISYKRFLVDSPLIFVPPQNSSKTIPPCGFGSFHQQYVIDGRLVAVGVVDILPKCLSSKYLFWDPDFAFLSLGKYSALQEINWVKETKVHCSSLQYYYLGYYIHSCSKMRYKASYCPSELLCPLRYEWVPFDIARPLLDKKSYVVLSDFAALPNGVTSPRIPGSSIRQAPEHNSQSEGSSDEDDDMELDFEASDTSLDDESSYEASSGSTTYEPRSTGISNIMIDLNGSRVKFKDLQLVFRSIQKRHIDSLELQLRRYVRAVGEELSSRLIYDL